MRKMQSIMEISVINDKSGYTEANKISVFEMLNGWFTVTSEYSALLGCFMRDFSDVAYTDENLRFWLKLWIEDNLEDLQTYTEKLTGDSLEYPEVRYKSDKAEVLLKYDVELPLELVNHIISEIEKALQSTPELAKPQAGGEHDVAV